jgi:hypothetical protein
MCGMRSEGGGKLARRKTLLGDRSGRYRLVASRVVILGVRTNLEF